MNKKKIVLIVLLSILIVTIVSICIIGIVLSNGKNNKSEIENNALEGIVVNESKNYEKLNIMTSQDGDVGIKVDSEGQTQINEGAIESKGAVAIYSKGTANLINSYAISQKYPAIVIEDNGIVTLDTSDIVSSGKGSKNEQIEDAGIILYSLNSNADSISKFTSVNSMVSIDNESEFFNSSPMFLVKNTKSEINLENTMITYGSGILLKAQGENTQVTINTKMQNLEGNIIADDGGILNINLLNETNYMGAINSENVAKEVNINISSNSLWMVTNDTYITTITVEDESLNNIMSGGNNIYYDSSNEKNAWLGGQTILLNGAGYLMPKK